MKRETLTSRSTGKSHLLEGSICQDASLVFEGEDFVICAIADGHGSPEYFRSHLGSQFAVECVVENAKQFWKKYPTISEATRSLDQFKLSVLTDWNNQVDFDISQNPFTEAELNRCSERKRQRVLAQPAIAYGSTLLATLWSDEYLLHFQIGDGLIVRVDFNLQIEECVPNEADYGGSITDSLCQEDSFQRMRSSIQTPTGTIAIVLCSDGVINGYQSLERYRHFFILKALYERYRRTKETTQTWVDQTVHVIANAYAGSDDSTIAMAFFDTAPCQQLEFYPETKIRTLLELDRSDSLLIEEKIAAYHQLDVEAIRTFTDYVNDWEMMNPTPYQVQLFEALSTSNQILETLLTFQVKQEEPNTQGDQ